MSATPSSGLSRAEIARGLQGLGLAAGDTAFVHASLRSAGPVDGGAATVVEAFVDVLGSAGTLAMPIFHDFFWGGPDQVWDRDATPSRMGAISEALRTWPGAQRSAHAPHPVAAVGRRAAELAACANRSDFAFDSPFQRLVELDAWVVLFGVGWNVCTLFHLLEEQVEVPYREWVELTGTVVDGGRRRPASFPFLRRRPGVSNDFGPMAAQLEAAGVVAEARVGTARVRAVRACDLVEHTWRALRRDPLALVSADSRQQAAAMVEPFGPTVARTSRATQWPLAPAQPLARRLAAALHVTRAAVGPRVRLGGPRCMPDGVVLEQVDLLGGVNDRVPGALALPADRNGPLPAIICLPGTSGSWHRPMDGGAFGQRGHTCPGWAREWTRRGAATLALSQLNQPPRREPWDWSGAKLYAPYGHTPMGRLVADVVAAVDYLTTRPEVDAGRIGVAGFSLGGIVAFYSFAVDARLAAAVSFCGGVGSVDELLQRGAKDFHSLYYYVPGLLAEGLDHPDLVTALAPRPLLVCGATRDEGMPEAGLRRFDAAARSAWAAAGAADAYEWFHEDGEHALSRTAFEHASAWLTRVGAAPLSNPDYPA